MLVYDCYRDGMMVKTVKTYKEVEEWKNEKKGNKVKERLINYSNAKPETDSQRDARLRRMNKIARAIKAASM